MPDMSLLAPPHCGESCGWRKGGGGGGGGRERERERERVVTSSATVPEPSPSTSAAGRPAPPLAPSEWQTAPPDTLARPVSGTIATP